MKKRIVFIGVIVVFIGLFAFVILNGKTKNTNNVYNTQCAYYDDSREYISELTMDFNLETDDTYREKIKLSNDHKYNILIDENTLNNSISLRLKDGSDKVLCDQTLNANEQQFVLGGLDLEGGDYTLEMKLEKGSRGTLEIKINEK